MEQKSEQNPHSQKTTVNRILLFFLIGFASVVPLWLVIYIGGAWVMIFLAPLIAFVALIYSFANEKRVSEVQPRLLEFFLAALGAFYPPVLGAISLWVVWWASYGIAVIVGGSSVAAESIASWVQGIVSVVLIIFLVRMGWQHMVDQLYPQMGGQTAFAQITKTGKLWILKRGIIYSIIFFVIIVTLFFVVFGVLEVSDVTPRENFIVGVALLVLYLFFARISAWLWLRKSEIFLDVGNTSNAISRMLEPSGYAVKTLIQIKEGLEPNGEFSELMTASVDLIALKEGNSLVIDVMTRNETIEIPDWTTASEFRMAAMYLQGVLKLPPPIDAILILVDVEADESLHRFSEKHDIRVIQFSGQEVLELLKPDINETALQTTVATHFPRFESKAVNGKTSHQPILVNGGRNE